MKPLTHPINSGQQKKPSGGENETGFRTARSLAGRPETLRFLQGRGLEHSQGSCGVANILESGFFLMKKPLEFTGPHYSNPENALALRLAARHSLDLLLLRSARFGPLRLGSGLLAGGALQFLPFLSVFNLGGICHLYPLSLQSLHGFP
jgi:hypothetical protein